MPDTNKELIDLLNKIIELSGPIDYDHFNRIIEPEYEYGFEDLNDDSYSKNVVTTAMGNISTVSLITTITKMLCGRALAWKINRNRQIVGVQWYTEEDNK